MAFRSALVLPSFLSRRGLHTLVVADHNNLKLKDASLASIVAAGKIGGKVSVLVAGQGCSEVAQSVSKVEGVSNVVLADNEALAHFMPENLSKLIVSLQKANNYTHIVTAATSVGKNFIPRLAASFDAAPITDVIDIKSTDTFVRPIYAGNALSTVKSSDSLKFITIRPTNFSKANVGSSSASVENATVPPFDNQSGNWIKDEGKVSDRVELTAAKVVVAGGRGMKSAENFKILEDLADTLQGAVGASRAAVDAGFAANEIQIGQTGKVVAPELYIAVGISGAIQHLAGMKDSKVIVAVIKDPEAPIFEVSDYGLVGDLFKVVPELNEAIRKAKK